MTKEELFTTLKQRFAAILEEAHIQDEPISVRCRALSPEEAIGHTKRQDYPIITGKDVMIQAQFRGALGQAFTDAPTAFTGSLQEILTMDILEDPRGRGLFIATLNAVMASLHRCEGTVHCRSEGPERCSQDMAHYLQAHYPAVKAITLVGYQPALMAMLAQGPYTLRILDLNPQNIGQAPVGVTVEDGVRDREAALASADLVLCTGSTLCNGTIVDFLDLPVPVLFFGITIAGAAPLLGLNRVCFAQDYAD